MRLEFISNFYIFLASVLLISLSGVLMPGPLFAVTITKAAKSKVAGALIAVGHGIVEFPLMILIFFVLSQFGIPRIVEVAVGLVGGFLMILMGFQAFRSRNRQDDVKVNVNKDSILAGIWTTAVNAGFILWWLTIGTALILNVKQFGLVEFSIFAGVHWLTDFLWYTFMALLVFKSKRFWTGHVKMAITFFCVSVFVGFGVYFIVSAIWSLLV